MSFYRVVRYGRGCDGLYARSDGARSACKLDFVSQAQTDDSVTIDFLFPFLSFWALRLWGCDGFGVKMVLGGVAMDLF